VSQGVAAGRPGNDHSGLRILCETPDQRAAVLALNRAAFGGDGEADLISRLDGEGTILASLVAVEDGAVTGHILFSRLTLEVEGEAIKAAALAPLAVEPQLQRRGIGSALTAEGLRAMRQRGMEAVIVLGHPDYYARFGFRHDLVARIESPFTQYEAFMGLELADGVLAGRPGRCTYSAAFGV